MHFHPCTPKLLIFSPIQKKATVNQRKVDGALPARELTLILVGLSPGGVLALDLSRQDFPATQGLVLAEINTNSTPIPLSAPDSPFRLLPKHVFEKQDANKQQMLQILTELKGLNLTDTVKAFPLSLAWCDLW